MPHDFKNFPELTNSQMEIYYFESPHKQIFEDFRAEVVGVHDGDTIKLRADFRDFDFPLRFLDIAAPELKDDGGPESQGWLEGLLLGEVVDVKINPVNRVEKWGRLLGDVVFKGIDVGNQSVALGFAKTWDGRNEGKIIDFYKTLDGVAKKYGS